MLLDVLLLSLYLLSVSASWGPAFRRYFFSGLINQDETWAQGVSVCDLIYHNIIL